MDYRIKFHRVLDYIDTHLDENLDVEILSQVSYLSKYHFHRQFSALYGMGVSVYIKKLRFKRAAYQLAFRVDLKVIDIALSSGYESSEAFSRAFSNAVGQSPSSFRKEPNWFPWQESMKPLIELRHKIMKEKSLEISVKVVDFAETGVAVLEHKGAPETLGNTVREFIKWRKEVGLPPNKCRTFNLLYSDPNTTAPDDYRFDLCVSVKRDIEANSYGVVNKVISEGRCAVVRHVGSDDTIGGVIDYLYSQWLNENNEELRDFPLFFERVSFFPEVPENQMITDVYLPLK